MSQLAAAGQAPARTQLWPSDAAYLAQPPQRCTSGASPWAAA